MVITRATSLQKPRWQALMLSFRRSSWALPPETLSMSLITQIAEHLSMVCGTRPQQVSEQEWWLSSELSSLRDHLCPLSLFPVLHPASHAWLPPSAAPASQSCLQVLSCALLSRSRDLCTCHNLCLASICPLGPPGTTADGLAVSPQHPRTPGLACHSSSQLQYRASSSPKKERGCVYPSPWNPHHPSTMLRPYQSFADVSGMAD